MTSLLLSNSIISNNAPNEKSAFLLTKELPDANFERNGKRNFIVRCNNLMIEKVTGIKNYTIDISYFGKVKSVNYRKISAEIDKVVSKNNEDKKQWLSQETINLLSSEINKLIDKACIKYNVNINDNEKKDIFKKVSANLEIKEELNIKCAQSSIWQTIDGSGYMIGKINQLYNDEMTREDKNKLKAFFNSELTALIYFDKYKGIDLRQLKEKAAIEIEKKLKS